MITLILESPMARVPYVTQSDLDPSFEDYIISSLQPGKTVNVYSAIGNNQEVLGGFRDFLGALWNHSGLTDRQREIVILTAASEIRSSYEWHQHVNISRNVGLEEKEIDAIAQDNRTPFSKGERELIAYTRAVVRGRVEEPLHESISEHFDHGTIVGVASLAAAYVGLGRVIDALDVEIEESDDTSNDN
jgi:alkylhydroperoxidase family enzyme